MTGKELRAWLDRHIDNPDPYKPEEIQRIQDKIDSYFSRHSEILFDEKLASETMNAVDLTTGMTPNKTNELMLTVAKEKAFKIDQQRPAIRAIGKDALYQLVIRIFDDIYRGNYEDIRIAEDFGLSKATFSRFAGSKWSEKLGKEKVEIPDLWKNTAKILASETDFTELALKAGVLPKLKKVMGVIEAGNG